MSVVTTSISFHLDHIDVVLEGCDATSREYVAVQDQVFDAAEKHACPRILFDASKTSSQCDVILEHDIAVDLASRRSFIAIQKFAVVSPGGVVGANEHFVNTAQNRGLSVRGFKSRVEALAWLLVR